MQFVLRMNTDSAAFEGADDDFGAGPEVARILRELADKLDTPADMGVVLKWSGGLVDFNGNTVGRWAFGTGSHDFDRLGLGVQ